MSRILSEKSERGGLSGNYPYLNGRDSALYHKVKDSEDVKDQVIKELLEEKAQASRDAHCADIH